jgi:hypothetical protein
LATNPGDLRDPIQALIIELRDRLDAVHELRELLELGPLVVRDAERDVNEDALFNLRAHGVSLIDCGRARTRTHPQL